MLLPGCKSRVKYISHGNGYALFLTPSEAVLVLRQSQAAQFGLSHGESAHHDLMTVHDGQLGSEEKNTTQAILRSLLLGANPNATISADDELPGKANYFIGNDPKKWRTNIPSYGKIRYGGVYPGVDLVYYGNQAELEYDFVVEPEASPKQIRFAISGEEIATQTGTNSVRPIKLRIDKNGGG